MPGNRPLGGSTVQSLWENLKASPRVLVCDDGDAADDAAAACLSVSQVRLRLEANDATRAMAEELRPAPNGRPPV